MTTAQQLLTGTLWQRVACLQSHWNGKMLSTGRTKVSAPFAICPSNIQPETQHNRSQLQGNLKLDAVGAAACAAI